MSTAKVKKRFSVMLCGILGVVLIRSIRSGMERELRGRILYMQISTEKEYYRSGMKREYSLYAPIQAQGRQQL